MGTSEKLIVHDNNARAHNVKVSAQFFRENRMIPVRSPPYFPDLVPPDFYLFHCVKRCRADLLFESDKQFVEAIQAVLDGIETVTLQAIFVEWMDCLRKCATTKGEHTDSAQTNVTEEWSFLLSALRCSPLNGTCDICWVPFRTN
jgi:hypothetical protein